MLTSAVGTGRHSCSPTAPSIAAMMSTGRKSIAFISSTQMKTVSAAGRRSGCGRRGGKPLDLVVDELEGELRRTPGACSARRGRSAHHPPDEADAHDTDEQRRHQRIRAASRSRRPDRLGEEREVVLDVFRRGKRLVCGHLNASVLANKERHRIDQHGHHERADTVGHDASASSPAPATAEERPGPLSRLRRAAPRRIPLPTRYSSRR